METRNGNHDEEVGITIAGRPVPYQTGVLPKDFPQRLERLREASDLTWSAFADALGVDEKQVHRWRNGAEPSGGAFRSLMKLAAMIPGGVDILMGEGYQMSLWQN